MTFNFDIKESMRAIEVYATAIEAMYHIALQPYTAIVRPMFAGEIQGYNVLVLFVNPQRPQAPNQLKIAHCVAALYRAVNVMTEGVMFYHLRCDLKIHGTQIGALSIAPITEPSGAALTNATSVDNDPESEAKTNTSAAAVGGLGAPSGQIADREHPEFVIKFHFYGKTILSKEVALVVLEALTVAAPFSRDRELIEHHALSPDGGCAIIIEKVSNPATSEKLTYEWAIRALRLLFQRIIMPTKTFGD
ncbi:MAG: hypothetical protein Q9200_007786, partial [Gallowayella weberi]